MNYMPRLASLKVLVMSDLDVVEHEEVYMLAKNKEDLDNTVEMYKNLYNSQGEVFVRTEWLSLSYSNAITNELSATNAKFLPWPSLELNMGHEIDIDHMLFFKYPSIKRNLDDYGRAQYRIRFFSREELISWFDNNNTTVFFDYRESKIIELVYSLPTHNIIVDFVFDFKKSDNPAKVFIETLISFKF